MTPSPSLDERITGLVEDVRPDLRRELQSLLRTLRDAGNAIGVLLGMSRVSLRLVGDILDRAGHKRPSDNLYDCIAVAARGDPKKKIKGLRLLPDEMASYLHTMRTFSNKADHDAERVALRPSHAENALDQFLHVLEWFYCEYERGPRLPTIYRGGPAAAPQGPDAGGWSVVGDLKVRLQALFDQTAYPGDEDPVCRFLLEWELSPQARGAGAASPPGTRGVSADVFLVLDVSGSMDQPDRYPLLRQAVEQFLRTLAPDDRVGIALFSTDADLILAPTAAGGAQDQTDAILQRMDLSHLKFAGATRLAPGLRAALATLPQTGGSVQRVYVLTDGELHDPEECQKALAGFRPRKVEVHAYGFGTEFDAAALKRLISDQLGGSVKPICDTKDVVRTFAHIAEVNRRLVASEGLLTLEFGPQIACGDAWAFRPQERHLGPIKNRRLVRELGGLEAHRVYGAFVEVRLPVDAGPATSVARARLAWGSGEARGEYTAQVEAPRVGRGRPGAVQSVPRVAQVYSLLDAMRREADPSAQVAGLKARRELAVLEGRDPALLAALDQQIDVLEGKTSAAPLDEEVQQYLASDEQTWDPGPPGEKAAPG